MGPHVVAIPFQAPGHINPLLHLCKQLADLGLQITLVITELVHKERFASCPSIHPGIKLVTISDGFLFDQPPPPPREFPDVKMIEKSLNNMRISFEIFIQGLMDQKIPVSCILSDAFLGWTQDVADKFGIPRAAFNTCSATTDALMSFVPQLVREGYIPVKGTNGEVIKDELIQTIPGMTLKPTDLPIALFKEDPIRKKMHEDYEKMFQAKYVLSNTFEELESERVKVMREVVLKSPNYLPVGPLLPRSYLGLEEKEEEGINIPDKECLDWLDKQKPGSVLYISFGSAAILPPKQMTELAMALEASKQPFLWVIRCGPSLLEPGFLSRSQGYGLIVNWCPQLKVLAHRSVGGFLSHCGWNSALESMCAGVPIIGWPCFAEQNFNAKFLVEDYGVAISLWKGQEDRLVKCEEIEEAIGKLMKREEGKVLRERALQIKEAARKSVTQGGCSNANLQRFVAAMGIPSDC